MLAILSVAGTASGQVALVRDGEAHAVVVTAAKPSPVATYATEELVTHVEKATGQRLPVVAETAGTQGYGTRVFVGVTEAARTQGIDPGRLDVEEFILRSIGSDLYIVGKEMHQDQYTGTRPHGEPWTPLSGECVHSGLKSWDVPFRLDVTEAVRWGEENQITVRVHNAKAAGGIWKPVTVLVLR